MQADAVANQCSTGASLCMEISAQLHQWQDPEVLRPGLRIFFVLPSLPIPSLEAPFMPLPPRMQHIYFLKSSNIASLYIPYTLNLASFASLVSLMGVFYAHTPQTHMQREVYVLSRKVLVTIA